MEELIKNLFDTTIYLIAMFDSQDRIIYANEPFSRLLGESGDEKAMLDKFKMRQNVEFKKGIEFDNKMRVIIKSDENQDHMFKFEISRYDDYKLAIGIKLDYEDIISLGEDMLAKDFVKFDTLSKMIEKRQVGFDGNSYSTILFDHELKVNYVSSNFKEIFGMDIGSGQRICEMLGEEYESFLREKMKTVDIFGIVTIDYGGNFATLSRHDSKYYVLNIHPYSQENNDKFEELQSLNRKIKKLEIELNNKNKLIKVQRMIFENITSVDDMTKLQNRSSFFKNIESEILKAKKLEYPLVMTILSLENLKKINLSKGTKYGDEALREIADSIKSLSRKDLDTGYRLSSHEFLIISLDSHKEDTKSRFETIKDLSAGDVKMNIEMSVFELDLSLDSKEIVAEINKMTHNI